MSTETDFLEGLPEYVRKNVHFDNGFFYVYDEAGLQSEVVKTEEQVYEAVVKILDRLDGLGRLDKIDALVDLVSRRLRQKLLRSELKYGQNNDWMKEDWQPKLVQDLLRHVLKGDPVDVMAYAAFAIHHDWSVSPLHGGLRPSEDLQIQINRVLPAPVDNIMIKMVIEKCEPNV